MDALICLSYMSRCFFNLIFQLKIRVLRDKTMESKITVKIMIKNILLLKFKIILVEMFGHFNFEPTNKDLIRLPKVCKLRNVRMC